jgi:hypothetical protein
VKGLKRPPVTTFTKLANNKISIQTAAADLTIGLSPQWIDFNRRATISVNGKQKSHDLVGSIADMLEDVRTRGDRQYPFWLKQKFETGNRR